MLRNNTNKPIYLVSGICLAGADCIATEKEMRTLCRQNNITGLDDEPGQGLPPSTTAQSNAPAPLVTEKKPSSKAPKVTPDPTPTPTEQSDGKVTVQLVDEFGPIKGTVEWSDLTPTQKMLITRARNQKYGPP